MERILSPTRCPYLSLKSLKWSISIIKTDTEYLKRLAFVTLTEEDAAKGELFHLNGSKSEEIDCAVDVYDIDLEKCFHALDCYVTFQETIEKSKIKDFLHHRAVFEIFQENFNPPLGDLFDKLAS